MPTLNLNKAEFLKSAVSPSGFLAADLPCIVFAGKSNVGKSSVINRLLNRKNFARVGSQPGKTVHVNYFCIDGRAYFVDLPGYGYASVAKTEFLSNMSHDIRTPINGILGMLEVIRDCRSDEARVDDCLGKIDISAKHLLSLVNDVLDMSKIEAGTFDFCPSLIDVNQTMEEIEQSMRLRLKKETVTLTFTERLPECTLYTDKNRLIQLISNFVINAIKFTQTGSIRMGYRLKDADTICFYVSDTGCGMSEEQCKHVFERFVKYNPFVQGTGLGLSICQMIIDRLGGTIGVESEENKGSTFWFTLPYRQE